MSESNRTQKAVKNASITMICQMVYILVSFVCRTVFTKILGSEYLGLNGLFTNILSMLSFVELGIGSALVYKMYKPLKEHDEEGLIVLLKFYKKAYDLIALIVAVIGLSLVPFLDYLVDAPTIKINIRLLYILFLLDTVISYLYTYKKSILIADQKNYIVAIYTQVFNIVMNSGQIVILILTHNYILYLVFKILCDWLCNIVCAIKANKEYPFIQRKTNKTLSKRDKNDIKESVKGLLLSKIASVAFDGTDNIFISQFVGISSVGIVSNYTLILNTVNSLFNQVFNSLTASVGNLGVDSSKNQIESVLKKLYFINAFLFGYLFVGMTLLLRFFIVNIWIGGEYYLSDITVFLLVLELCLRGIHFPAYMTRNALGKFSELKYIPPICAALNIILDFVLGKSIGIAGIILATIISRLITRFTDIWVLYDLTFGESVSNYYKMHIKFLMIVFMVGIISFFTLKQICFSNVWLQFLVDIGIITLLYFVIIFLIYGRSEELKYYQKMMKNILRKISKGF